MNEEFKPFLRGHFHQAAFWFGLGASFMLITIAPTPLARISAIVYTVSLALLFGVSSLYHRNDWPWKIEAWIQKLDHSAIFVFIAGTATPIALLSLPGPQGRELVMIFWAAALIGVIKEFAWKKAPRWVSGLMYVLMGWLAAPYLGPFSQGLGPGNTWMLVTGGVIYTLGALVYVFKWPDPFPKFFGFHEIFHALVVVAGICHFLIIYDLVLRSHSLLQTATSF